jgi:hypothetical protein
MVDEAIVLKLLPILTTHDPQRNDHRDRLVDLVSYTHTQHLFDTVEVGVLIAHIDQLKILDPACGSGAFPMGISHKLVHILGKLNPDNQGWRQRQIDRSGKSEDDIAEINASFSAHEPDYARETVLNPKLHLWRRYSAHCRTNLEVALLISLLVNQHVTTGKNRGILPLPNLETNFIAANTLLSLTEDERVDTVQATQRNLIDTELDALKAELQTQRNRYFTARTATTKSKARDEDKQIRLRMQDVLISSGWDAHEATMLATWDMYNQNVHADFFLQSGCLGLAMASIS